MAISTLASYLNKMNTVTNLPFSKVVTNTGSNIASSFAQTDLGGTVPTTPSVCDNTMVGAININSKIGLSGPDYRIVAADFVTSTLGNYTVFVYDRLSHQGGLVGNITTAQTTNLPTAALTRYTSGVGVMIGLEQYTGVGGTATTATVSYTNQAGTPGQISKPVVFGGAGGGNTVARMFVVPLADGDTGAKSVESVTLAASTGSAGNFGITLFKPLFMPHPITPQSMSYRSNNFNALIGGGCQFEEILEGACLSVGYYGSISSQRILGVFSFMDAST